MKIHLITVKAAPIQMREMLESLESYIKLAVDIEREIVAGGGILHADCEAVLLEKGSLKKTYGEPIGYLLPNKLHLNR